MTPSTMSNHTELITTRLSSGTYIAKCGKWTCSSTSSHQTAASHLVQKFLGDAFTAWPAPEAKRAAMLSGAGKNRHDWEWELFRIIRRPI